MECHSLKIVFKNTEIYCKKVLFSFVNHLTTLPFKKSSRKGSKGCYSSLIYFIFCIKWNGCFLNSPDFIGPHPPHPVFFITKFSLFNILGHVRWHSNLPLIDDYSELINWILVFKFYHSILSISLHVQTGKS